jgi:phosphatidylglycerophosphatase C
MEKKKLAIFDFDGTITSRDSMIEFVRFYRGRFYLFLSFVLQFPWLAGAKLGLVSRENAKKRFLSYHFKGESREHLHRKAAMFAQRVLPGILREKALDQIQFHRQHGHEVVVATASLDFWVEPWTRRMNLPCLCTQGKFENEKFTGEFLSANCSGEEKLRRIREAYALEGYDMIFGYGDTSEDKPFLRIAHKRHFKPFRKPVQKAVVD